jgi:hypothetical protein
MEYKIVLPLLYLLKIIMLMNIHNIKRVNLYEIPYGDEIILMTHEEFERYGVGSKEDYIANAKRPKRYYEVTIDGIVYTIPEDKFDEFIKSKI